MLEVIWIFVGEEDCGEAGIMCLRASHVDKFTHREIQSLNADE